MTSRRARKNQCRHRRQRRVEGDQARTHRRAGVEDLHSVTSCAWPPREMAAAPPPARLSADDYVGDVADRTGFAGLEAIDEVTMVCVPDLMSGLPAGPSTSRPCRRSSWR